VSYDALVIAAHPDDAETQMGGTLARLTDAGQRVLLVDLTDGERTEFAEPGVRAKQAHEAARILGVELCTLGLRDRLLQDTADARLKVAHIIRQHRPRWVLWDDFIRRNLVQGHWRVIRATRKFGVRAEDITRELERLGFEPSPDGRILPSTSLRFSVGSSQTGTRGHRCRAMRGRQPYRQIRLR
jgi:LmbE family N-acetylglucosaminyl deacetylase